MAMQISSPSFGDGETIPRKHTCEGDNVPPTLTWQGAPSGVRSFTLIAEDPDAPNGNFVHWIVYDLPPDTTQLQEAAVLPDGAQLGRNDFRNDAYGGPCPPPGDAHRYYFRLYALDDRLGLDQGASVSDVRKAMKGHVLEEAEVMGRSQRSNK